MQGIAERVFSHLTFDPLVLERKGIRPAGDDSRDGSIDAGYHGTRDVRASTGCPVANFMDLVRHVAEVGYHNQRYNLLFRGQDDDYLDKGGSSAVYPSIFRPEAGRKALRGDVCRQRFARLEELTRQLRKHHKRRNRYRHPEFEIALLQHYGICPTPLVDLTHSLLVAASFALLSGREVGYLLVFGLPHPHGRISHHVEERLRIVKLQNVCPPDAIRPHIQEGYLAGTLLPEPKRRPQENLARRLVAKYRLLNSPAEDGLGSFWGEHFRPIPGHVLLPDVHEISNLLPGASG